ncbi:ribonuclease P protein subunit p21 isoform X3 [Calonectris borealis]|uniref:ribonuclease P protein subunit p21 isoform X3 n=1 Tax=Calonectris borealis TaxID=1323832 RepID=UPI003F4B0298
MGNIGPAHSAGARPIGGAMAAPVRDREALQRLSFLFQPCPRPLLLQHPARGRPPPGPAHGPLGEAHRVPPLLLPAAARGRGLPAPAGWVWPRLVLRCRSCGRHRRYLCQQELRPRGQAPPTGPALEDSPA